MLKLRSVCFDYEREQFSIINRDLYRFSFILPAWLLIFQAYAKGINSFVNINQIHLLKQVKGRLETF